MRAKYMEEFGCDYKLIFASSVNKVENTKSRCIQEVFKALFNDSPEEVRFNSNSIRKFWERMRSKKIKPTVSEGTYFQIIIYLNYYYLIILLLFNK